MDPGSYPLEVDLTPPSDAVSIIHSGLRAFTDNYAGPVNARPFAIFVRGPEGNVLGGLDGELRWTWLYIAHLWLPEALRGRGLGSELLARAESFSQEQGCTAAYLDTLEFQALSFYQRRGYSTYGVLEGFPPGSRRYYLQKQLKDELQQAKT